MVKLCDRLHNMRTIEFSEEIRRRAKAEQTLDIYSPLAAKLNNEKVIAELNDLSVKYI
jgi:(p)ppGpp synthase/HD superfamily hydrolase